MMRMEARKDDNSVINARKEKGNTYNWIRCKAGKRENTFPIIYTTKCFQISYLLGIYYQVLNSYAHLGIRWR